MEIDSKKYAAVQQTYQQYYDSTAVHREFFLVDLVLFLVPEQPHNLSVKWARARVVVERLSVQKYKVSWPFEHPTFQAYHVNSLKKFYEWHAKQLTMQAEHVSFEEPFNLLAKCQQDCSLASVVLSPDLIEEQADQLYAMLQECVPIFTSKPECTNLIEHSIKTRDACPVALCPYRISGTHGKDIAAEFQDMLDLDIIKPSSGVWAAPVVLISKKDGSIRFCVDY